MIRPNTDADVAKQVCPSLLQWEDYVMNPHDNVDTKNDNKLYEEIEQELDAKNFAQNNISLKSNVTLRG
jgi:hypothetical protein